MEFKKFSTINCSYDADTRVNSLTNLLIKNRNQIDHSDLDEVLTHLALCHSILIDPKTKKFNSASPDELALVNGAKDLGYEFVNKDSDKIITIKTPYTILKFELLNVLEFTSSRKRMSVIVKDL